MKKFTKVSLIIAACFAICGSILLLIAASMGVGLRTMRQIVSDSNYIGWDDDWFWHSDTTGAQDGEEWQTFDSADVQNIILNISAAEIIFTEAAEDDTITVELQKGYTDKFECNLDDGTLSIDYKLKHANVKRSAKIAVGIPDGKAFDAMKMDVGASSLEFEAITLTCQTMKLNVGAGEVDLEYVEITDRLDIDLGVGSVDISDSVFGDIVLECGVGEISVEGSVSGDITAHCGMGEIDMELQGTESDYNYDLSCGMGSLNVNGVSYSGLGGSRKVANEGATKTLKLDCGMGEIDVEIHP